MGKCKFKLILRSKAVIGILNIFMPKRYHSVVKSILNFESKL
jgi:hypothetical protein